MKGFKILTAITTIGISCSFVNVYFNTKISFQADNLYPEGITYDNKRDLFYVSSIASGKIGAVDRKGNFKVACDDPRLVSTIGLKYNSKNDKLYALKADFGLSSKSNPANAGKVAQLAIINIATSKVEDMIDLSGLTSSPKRLGNDLTLDNEGNIYITDSYASVIYKVDKSKKSSVFAHSDLFKPDSNAVGLNGIAYHNEGYLIVAKTGEGSLLKIPLKDPSRVEKVKIPEALKWVDGIYFINDKELVAVRNRFQKTFFLNSEDHWQNAEIVKEEKSSDQMPTTATGYKNEVFVINSRMMDLREKKDNKTFVIDIFTK